MFPVILMLVEDPGDRDFLLRILGRYKRLIFSIAGKYAESPEDREEIYQSVVEKMVQHVDRLRRIDEKKLPAYIGTMSRNTAINFVKHKDVVSRHSLSLDVKGEYALPDWGHSPEDIVVLWEKREHLQEALSRLSETDRFLIEGKLAYGLTDAELAEVLRCKPRSITMMMTRARRRAVQEILKGGEEDEP